MHLLRMEWGWRWEGGSGWGTYVNPRLIHVYGKKPLQYCKVISFQLIKVNKKKKKKTLTPWKESYDQPRQHIKKQRHYLADKGAS